MNHTAVISRKELGFYEIEIKKIGNHDTRYLSWVFCHYNLCFPEDDPTTFYYFDPRTETRVIFYDSKTRGSHGSILTTMATQVKGWMMNLVDLPIDYDYVKEQFLRVKNSPYFRDYKKNVRHAALLQITKVFEEMGKNVSLRPDEGPIGTLVLEFIRE